MAKKYALISVSDKAGLAKFAKELKKQGYEIISSGGTAKFLRKAGLRPIEVSALTKYPHMLDGRVKTLHPVIYGGILADQTNPQHMQEIKRYKINPFSIVVCNLYPFEEVTSRKNCTLAEAIENIDIGGPSMVRAAAKNNKSVAIVVDPADYNQITLELSKNAGQISQETREKLALKAYQHTKHYDAIIVRYLSSRFINEEKFPAKKEIILEKVQELRYGENPHQQAALYQEATGDRGQGTGNTIVEAKQLHGKELSFNNIVDMDSAWNCVNYFAEPAVAIIKHNNPCGAAKADNVHEAYKKAYACDPVSAFGGIVAANRRVDEAMAGEMAGIFIEVVIAPGYTPGALEILREKKNIRIMDMEEQSIGKPFKGMDYKRVSGGMLIQDPDLAQLAVNEVKVVTQKQPSLAEMEDLFFAWGVVKYVKSNAIVLVKNGQAIGIGAGQMSRIDSANLAAKRARFDVKGAVLASDAFFPFPDVVELAARLGVSAIIQPGGSVKDQDSIDKANENGMAMLFTGRRHFRH
ncbi:MAG: bifunctional phosphoribosylaminoimidazolecarboxamide formyltransferase/IMP cyclohydrolase [Candidatus Margulisbacteria bacterium]|nr:bifunctional phosphoribosylaminoimidazolecarboxamide formyltransferase/IMP cyclohydrolase [Candidatus Margulisiibacteriota bacterium]